MGILCDITTDMDWAERVKRGNAPNIVVLDGKNIPHGLFLDLKKDHFPAHIFVSNRDGAFSHNPKFKGNDWSHGHRNREIERIRRLDRVRGVAACIIVCDGMYTKKEEAADLIQRIRAINPDIKLLYAGADIKNAEEKVLSASCDGSVFDYNQTGRIKEELIRLVPELEEYKKKAIHGHSHH